MINLSYNLSETIAENLKSTEELRKKILLTPINPKKELLLRWEANINKAYWGLTLADNPLSRAQMVKILSNPLPKKLKDSEKEVVSYMQTLSVIREHWTGSNKLITTKDILDIYDLSCKNVFGSTSTYYKSKVDLVTKILTFIESGKEHPVIQAGLLQIEIIKLSPFENGTGRVARLLSHLILSKYGYDLRGLLVIEDYYRGDLISLKEATKSIETRKNATSWLEYFTTGIKKAMEKTYTNVSGSESVNYKKNTSALLWKLSNRQKLIFEKLDNPNIKITNREVCKMFAISQITASRDLSKMVNLGLLLPHGKGRSTYYTK